MGTAGKGGSVAHGSPGLNVWAYRCMLLGALPWQSPAQGTIPSLAMPACDFSGLVPLDRYHRSAVEASPISTTPSRLMKAGTCL